MMAQTNKRECVRSMVSRIYKEAYISLIVNDELEYVNNLFMHGIAVAAYAGALADFLFYEEKSFFIRPEKIVRGALLHDIGKNRICKELLEKKDRLTMEEFRDIKKHPVLGYEMIKDIVDKTEADIVMFHHEKKDGSGYPYGLKYIPLHVQIVTVADIYDALTSARAYKRAYTHAQAITTLKEEAVMGKLDLELVRGLDFVIKSGSLARK